MNINELTEKNIGDAVSLYKEATKEYSNFISDHVLSDDEISEMFNESENNGDFTYLFYDRGSLLAMATIEKNDAEINNVFIRFELVDEFFYDKFLEFIIKQFSAISRVFVWVVSTTGKLVDVLENYGFEYTGEQEYISKEKNILKFRYIFRRKK